MKNVIEKLKKFSTQIDLKNRFDFNFDINDNIFSSEETEQLLTDKNPFDQNVRLKWILSQKYKTSAEQNFIDFWIVNNWGN